MALAPVWASIWPILTTSWAAAGIAARRNRANSSVARFMDSPLDVEGCGCASLASERKTLGDDLLHDLRRPRRDGPEPHVAEEALDRELPHVAVAAVHLDRLIRHPVRDLGREELGHGDLGDAVLARVVARRGVIDQMPRRLDLGRHVGDPVAQRLLAAERLAESLRLTVKPGKSRSTRNREMPS